MRLDQHEYYLYLSLSNNDQKPLHFFVCAVHFRHPNELGGAYWTFSLLISLASLPLATFTYKHELVAHDKVVNLSQMACYLLLPCLLVLFSVFFMTIDKEYFGTFFGSQRAKKCSEVFFVNSHEKYGEKDEQTR